MQEAVVEASIDWFGPYVPSGMSRDQKMDERQSRSFVPL